MEPLQDDDPTFIGGYTLRGRIGVGGMGQVHLGGSAAGLQVAVKVIKASVLDEDTRARFVLEVDSLKTVHGPFVAADEYAEQPWLTVEYVPGPDLRTFITGHGPLPVAATRARDALANLLERGTESFPEAVAGHGPKSLSSGLGGAPRETWPQSVVAGRVRERDRRSGSRTGFPPSPGPGHVDYLSLRS